jgi:RNA polymerase sigma factor (sigma-70 family)
VEQSDFLRLTRSAQGGDAAALNELCRELVVRLRAIVKHKIWWWSAQDQEDALQATLIVFVEKLPQIRDNPCAFAAQILSNHIGNEIQKRRRRQEVSISSEMGSGDEDDGGGHSLALERLYASDDDPERAVESRDQFDRVLRAIEKLKPFCRAVFKGMIEELYVGEIWETIQRAEPGLTRSAFDKRIYDCRKRLQKLVAH